MVTKGEPNRSDFVCLRETFRTTFPWKHPDLTRDAFRTWARNVRQPPINFTDKRWRPMRDGQPVPREMAEAFSEYIALRHILPARECRLSAIAEACDPSATSKRKQTVRLRPLWRGTWRLMYSQVTESLFVDDAAYCADQADLLLAATIVMECMGWHDKRLTGDRAIAYAEAVLKRSLDEYAQTLLAYWQANEHSVLFATQRQGDAVQRVGVNVAVAVTESFYRRFRDGDADEFHIEPTDYAPDTPYVMIQALAENVAIDLKRGKIARSMASSRTMLYQLAALFRPVHWEGGSPHVVTFAGSNENAKRLHSYGFKSTGGTLALNGEEILEFAPPNRDKLGGLAYAEALAEYLPMKSLVQIYQALIETQRPLPD